jgi:hypothetical protein
VQLRAGWLSICWIAACLWHSTAAAQDGGVTAKHHPWGRFQPGAWKLVRVVTDTLDEQGVVTSTSITETKTTLVKVEDDGVLLEVEVGIEMAGKQFDAQPQCVKQGFQGEMAGGELKVGVSTAAELDIEGRTLPCRVQQVESVGPNSKTVTKLYCSNTMAPYLLKRESTTTDLQGANVLSEMALEVIALNMPHRVLAETMNAACVKTVQKHPKGTIATLAWTVPGVPGEVVGHASKETDKNGRVVRRSTLELVSYGLQAEEERIGLFGRKRSSRLRKPPLLSPR